MAKQLDPFAGSFQPDLLRVKSRLENGQAGVNVVQLRDAPRQLLLEVCDLACQRGALVSEGVKGVAVAKFILSHSPNVGTERIQFMWRLRHNTVAYHYSEHAKTKNLSSEWNVLSARIVEATGASAERHLAAHNTVRKNINIFLGSHSEEEFFIAQDETQILAMGRKPDQADFDSLFQYSAEVLKLIDEIDHFLARV